MTKEGNTFSPAQPEKGPVAVLLGKYTKDREEHGVMTALIMLDAGLTEAETIVTPQKYRLLRGKTKAELEEVDPNSPLGKEIRGFASEIAQREMQETAQQGTAVKKRAPRPGW